MEAKSSNLKKIRKAVEKTLDSKRFEHTLGVEYTAAALAMRYGEDLMKAQTAGLLHDCAKCMSNEKRLSDRFLYGISKRLVLIMVRTIGDNKVIGNHRYLTNVNDFDPVRIPGRGRIRHKGLTDQ